MKQRVYVDTSVIGGVFDPEFKYWSLKLIQEFRTGSRIMIISDLTLSELEKAPENVREIIDKMPREHIEFISFDDDSDTLAESYLESGKFKRNQLLDAQHIALATIKKVDVLVSWNFKHIVNLNRIRLYNSVNLKYGYSVIEIRTPREILNEQGKKD